LTDKLNEVETERAHFRTFLQINDTQDSQDVVEAFKRLNVSIRNFSLTTSNGIIKAARVKSSWPTSNASNLAQLQNELAGAAGLVLSDTNTGRSVQDFLPEAFRFVINSALDEYLFQLFHPFASKNESDLLIHTYRQVRSRGEFSSCFEITQNLRIS
jgi:hypothetical protein